MNPQYEYLQMYCGRRVWSPFAMDGMLCPLRAVSRQVSGIIHDVSSTGATVFVWNAGGQ